MEYLKKIAVFSFALLSTVSFAKGILLDGIFRGKDTEGKEIKVTFVMLATPSGTATRIADCQGVKGFKWVPKEVGTEVCAKDQTKKCTYERNVVITSELYQFDQETGTNWQTDFSYVNELGIVSPNSLFNVFSEPDAEVIYLKGLNSGHTVRLDRYFCLQALVTDRK